jgi:hypothetical protein
MTGINAMSDPIPHVWVGYDHDGCDGVQDSVFEGAVRFDLQRLVDLPRKLITRAVLRYQETPGVERGPGGGPMSVFNCATRLDPSNEVGPSSWVRMSHGRPGHEHAIDGQRWYLVSVDDMRDRPERRAGQSHAARRRLARPPRHQSGRCLAW